MIRFLTTVVLTTTARFLTVAFLAMVALAALMASCGGVTVPAGSTAEEISVSLVVEFEGKVMRDGVHVTYDDATGRPCRRRPWCAGCGRFVDGPHSCGAEVAMKWDCRGVPTIGYGTTDEASVNRGEISEEEARRLLARDLSSALAAVRGAVRVELTELQVAALSSFAYNVGIQAFLDSTLLRLLNEGGYDEVPGQLRRWNKSGGRVLRGLVRRREREAELFMRDVHK